MDIPVKTPTGVQTEETFRQKMESLGQGCKLMASLAPSAEQAAKAMREFGKACEGLELPEARRAPINSKCLQAGTSTLQRLLAEKLNPSADPASKSS